MARVPASDIEREAYALWRRPWHTLNEHEWWLITQRLGQLFEGPLPLGEPHDHSPSHF